MGSGVKATDPSCTKFVCCAGEVPPGPGEYALASHYDVCSTATVEPAFSIPGGRGLGSSRTSITGFGRDSVELYTFAPGLAQVLMQQRDL